MKQKMIKGIILLTMLLSLTACETASNEKEQKEQTDAQQEEQEKDDTTDKEQTEDIDSDTEADQGESEEPQQIPVNISVYYCNDDATAFDTEEVEIESLSPENIIAALADKGATGADIEVISFEETEVDGQPAIDLDLSKSFEQYVSSMGSTGEYYAIGSVGNTFLQAYDCERIKITVEGNVLETGHAEYPGYLTMFE